ncbi:MAG: class I SAM-dependent methyltransferase [Micromonosporaceae bacterium]
MAGQLRGFLREFAQNPQQVGALAPSSPRLTAEAVQPVPRSGDPVVVELGPGTGAFTAAIEHRLAGRGRHLAVELNPRLAAKIADRHSGVEVINADATDLSELLKARDITQVDVIVSGLPWASFPESLQTGLLDAVVGTLCPGGAFTTYAYVHALRLPPARRFRANLKRAFEEVVIGRTIWRNLPPALVYHARRPRTAD